jgi:hypothetical protein
MRLASLTTTFTPIVIAVAVAVASLAAGCTVYQEPPRRVVYVQAAPIAAPAPVYVEPAPVAYAEPVPQPVVSVYVEPPIMQPEPILVGWAPPPLLVEMPSAYPYTGAVWVGGYWVWEGNWVWAAGRWAPPPQPSYVWVHPYYEHRDSGVVFITGHWCPPGVLFVPPPLGIHLTLVTASIGVIPGPRPIGPLGVFVPAPPGSRLGLIIPAPIGTAPAVVTSAAPVVNVGMRIQNNTTRINNVTNVTNVSNVTIVAPASATASGKAYEGTVPAQAHLSAALPAMVKANAPTPLSAKPIPSYVAGRAPAALPPPQTVRMAAAPMAAPQAAAQVGRPAPMSAAPANANPAGNATASATPNATPERQPSAVPPRPGSDARAQADASRSRDAAAVPTAPARAATAQGGDSREAAAQANDPRARAEQQRMAKAQAAGRGAPKEHVKRKKEEAQKVHGEKAT